MTVSIYYLKHILLTYGRVEWGHLNLVMFASLICLNIYIF